MITTILHIGRIRANVKTDDNSQIPKKALEVFAAKIGGAAVQIRMESLEADAMLAVRNGLAEWAAASGDELLRWAAEDPDGAALRERWSRDLARWASDLLNPCREWLLAKDDSDIPCPITDDELSRYCAPLAAGVILRALSDETRAEVLAAIDRDAPRLGGWVARFSRWFSWLGITVRPVSENEQVIVFGYSEARYLRALVQDLWRSRWQAEAAEAIRGHRYTPALIRPVHADLADALTLRPMDPAQLTLPGLVPVISGAAEAISRAMRKAEALSPTAAHHLIRWLVRAAACAWDVGPGHEARIGDDAFARRLASGVEIEIVGGFDGLRNAIGMSSKKTDIRSIIEILASHSIPWAIPNREGRGPLLSFDNTQARPGIQARLIIGLSPLLCPGLASEKSVLQSDKVLIPCLPPPKLPTGGRSHGPLLTLDWLAIMDMGTRRMELLTAGGVRLDWPRLADRAGVSSQALRRTLDLWLDPAEGRWAMPAEGLYRLADRGQEGHAHRLLIDGATMSSQAAIAGKNAAAKRESARSRQK